MNKKLTAIAVVGLMLSIGTSIQAQTAPPKKDSATDRIARATQNINKKQLYDLTYKLKKDAEVRWVVEQVAETTFSMAGEKEETTSRSKSEKLWKIANVDSLGNMTFVYSIEAIDMWQQIDESDPSQYNSRTDEEVPDDYQRIADRVGKPHAIFTISPYGKIMDRKSSFKEDKFGVGKVTIPLPGKPIPVGFQWDVPTILEANDENNRNRKLKARILYELAKVKGQMAYIKFRTEILTPNITEKMKSTIMQQMTDGYIVFDLENGYHVLKRVEWDEKAQGFEGNDSFLKYVGRLSEKLIASDSKTGSESETSLLAPIQEDVAVKPVQLKTHDGAPVMRK